MKEEIILPGTAACAGKFKQTFRMVAEADLVDLLARGNVLAVRKGGLVYAEESRTRECYLLYSGVVKIFHTGSGGKEQIIRVGKEGDIFGFRSIIRGEPACTSVQALTDCVLCLIPDRVLLGAIARVPSFAHEMVQIACKELGDANRYIRDVAQKSVRARLADILLRISVDFGLAADGSLSLCLTREDLGNFVGTATETLIRLLSEFKAEGLIEARGRRIRLLDAARLRVIAGRG
ncbi:MAG: Crp/Fnr family transcriptional regulator [Odoribacteraceae bacterium]|jgi:CRP-like cAMP-binding protein|nr:Crp/Fnr family transcriptional regulator [Odoribacteraceae bacterium]